MDDLVAAKDVVRKIAVLMILIKQDIEMLLQWYYLAYIWLLHVVVIFEEGLYPAITVLIHQHNSPLNTVSLNKSYKL